MSELGIDEAGRGPVLGPMVMAGVIITPNSLALIADWEKEFNTRIQDSKLFGSSRKAKDIRTRLSNKIQNALPCVVKILSPALIDTYVRKKSLNILEQETAQKIIDQLPAEQTVLDGANLFKPLETATIKAFNKADQDYLSVSAASIVAKAERDRLFEENCQPFLASYGEIKGGGYANAKTLEFVAWHYQAFGKLPNFYRKSYQWQKLNLFLNQDSSESSSAIS